MNAFKRLVVPVDHSDLTDTVIDIALQAMGERGHVVFLHVRRDAADVEGDAVEGEYKAIDADLANLKGMVERRLGDQPLDDERVRFEVRAGDVVEAVLTTADEHSADLIIMGTHGRKGIYERFAGSMTERVVAQTDVNVLVVKPEGFPFLRD